MEIGAFFILLIVLAVLAVLGGGVYLIAARLRGRELDSRRNRLAEHTDPDVARDDSRPEHARVESEQRSRYVGSR